VYWKLEMMCSGDLAVSEHAGLPCARPLPYFGVKKDSKKGCNGAGSVYNHPIAEKSRAEILVSMLESRESITAIRAENAAPLVRVPPTVAKRRNSEPVTDGKGEL
jgi:hypothetical protein